MTTRETASILMNGLSSLIRGKERQIELFVTAYLSGGHVLLEDVPGIGKTTLAKGLAQLVGTIPGNSSAAVTFRRIQFTPDLLPYDITGVDVFNPKEYRFEFIPGPVFCDILLADEINRTTPKVQSALLEVMAEHQVSSGGKTRQVSDLFFVVATQNPIESEGTYPLPAAQLDRFMLRLSLGYPDGDSERAILRLDPAESILPALVPVITDAQIRDSRREQKNVFCHPALEAAVVTIVQKTRVHPALRLGVSPRGALQLLHAARTLALIRGRAWLEDTDIIDLAVPVFSHRVIAKDHKTDIESLISGITSATLQAIGRKTDWTRDVTADEPA